MRIEREYSSFFLGGEGEGVKEGEFGVFFVGGGGVREGDNFYGNLSVK
jgi:hypothetical protein